MQSHRFHKLLAGGLSAGMVLLGLTACGKNSTKPVVLNPPGCQPPASTLLKDGYWQRTWTWTANGAEPVCEPLSSYSDTVLWVGLDFVDALNGGDPSSSGPFWTCSNFTFAIRDTLSDGSGCRYVYRADGGGAFKSDLVTLNWTESTATSGTCPATLCSNRVNNTTVWLAPPVSELAVSRGVIQPHATGFSRRLAVRARN